MNLNRISRLLKLLQILQGEVGRDVDALAAHCGVSRRTIFRDLETLRASGVPLEFNSWENRYSIGRSYFLPPTNFTAEEALSLIALAGKLGGERSVPFLAPARQAIRKLESALPPALRDEVHKITDAMHLSLPKISPLIGKQTVYQQLVDAVAQRHVVRMHYRSLTEWELISTKLRTYQLFFGNRSWYAIGRSSLHREVRMFNLNRIAKLRTLKERYAIPRSFSMETYLGNAWQLIPDSHDQQVVVRFQPMVAQNVAEVLWHKTQQLKWNPDGTLDFRAKVSGFSEIAWWVLGYGDQAEVLRPKRLRRILAFRTANMHRIYNGTQEA